MVMIDLHQDWLKIIKELISTHLPSARVVAYGSRVNGTSHDASDLDLVAHNPVDANQPLANLPLLQAAFSSSNLPISVDIVDWARIPESFRQEIMGNKTVVIYDCHTQT